MSDDTLILKCDLRALEYQFRIRLNGSKSWTEFSSSDKPELEIKNLDPGATYEFAARVHCGLRETSGWSKSQFVQLPNCPPAELDDFEAIDIDHNRVHFECAATADEYQWRLREQGSPTWFTLPFNVSTGHILINIQEATIYEFAVRLKCGTDESAWSAAKTFTTPLACPPAELADLSATNIAHDSVRFECAATADEFQWRWRVLGASTWATSNFRIAKALSLIGILEGTTYEYAVQLQCGGFVSAWSPPKTFRSLGEQSISVSLISDISRLGEKWEDQAVIRWTRSEAVNRETKIIYNVTGDAVLGLDYMITNGEVTIPAGETSATMTLRALDDTEDEPDESLTIQLNDGVNYIQGSQNTVTLQIQRVVFTSQGDTNGDGTLDIRDIVQVTNHLNAVTILTNAAFDRADTNGDGQVNTTDLEFIVSLVLCEVQQNR